MALYFSNEQLDQIEDSLNTLHWDTEAKSVLLADQSGQFISKKGDTSERELAVLSALAAAQLSATQEIARLVGERNRFRLLQEGDEQNVYICEIDANLILVVVFKSSTPLGMVRMVIRQVVNRIGQIAEDSRWSPLDDEEDLTDDDFSKLLADQLDDMLL